MKTNITLGVIQISDWKPIDKLYPSYYDEEEDCKEYLTKYAKLDPHEIILEPDKVFVLEITYPLRAPCQVKISTGKHGISRLNLVSKIVDTYRKIYKIEDKSTRVKAGYIPGMLNRNFTDGKFGIWGHCIEDLVLCSAHIDRRNRKITLGVDS